MTRGSGSGALVYGPAKKCACLVTGCDGCGAAINCGACAGGEVCGIQIANKCDPPPACNPLSCAAQQAQCGAIGDGCGNLQDCGACPPGESCGIVSPNRCDGIQ